MKYCKNCGKELDDTAVVCPHCGVQQESLQGQVVDSGSIGWGVLGCCIPIAGLILFLVWKDTKPATAKMAGMGALIAVIGTVLLYVILAVLGIGAGIVSTNVY